MNDLIYHLNMAHALNEAEEFYRGSGMTTDERNAAAIEGWSPGAALVRGAIRDVAMTSLTPARFAAAVRASVGVVRGWTGNLPPWAEAPAGRILDAVEGRSADIGMGLSDLTLTFALALIDGPKDRGHPPPGDPDCTRPVRMSFQGIVDPD